MNLPYVLAALLLGTSVVLNIGPGHAPTAVALAPHIISSSWGSNVAAGPLSAADQALAASIAVAVAQGISVVFSAGNGDFGFPGQHPDVIAAGGVYLDPSMAGKLVFEEPRPLRSIEGTAYPLVLLTGRGSSAQWHTGTRTEKSGVLRKLSPAGIYIEINPFDAESSSRRGNVVRDVGCFASQFVRLDDKTGDVSGDNKRADDVNHDGNSQRRDQQAKFSHRKPVDEANQRGKNQGHRHPDKRRQ